MVKLDAKVLRYMTRDEFRVLTAVEMGMKNHELVPTTLILRIAGLKNGMRIICTLHRNKLIYHEAKIYDGYKLTSLGYDYLALKTLVNRGLITGLGSRIGVGKESDIYEVVNAEGKRMVLKIHRLGRVCFRAIKNTRDYLLHRTAASWLYMARLAATREFAYMKALYEHGFPTPEPFDFNRHCVLMSLVHAHPMGAVTSVRNCGKIYTQLMNMIVRLAEHGLIHCDFNEFNLMIGNDENVFLIDFPQMVSTSHRNAQMYFERDVECVRTFFLKRFKYATSDKPSFFSDVTRSVDLDTAVMASGSRKPGGEDHKQSAEDVAFEQFVEARNDGELIIDDVFEESDNDQNEDENEEGGKSQNEGDSVDPAHANGSGDEADVNTLDAEGLARAAGVRPDVLPASFVSEAEVEAACARLATEMEKLEVADLLAVPPALIAHGDEDEDRGLPGIAVNDNHRFALYATRGTPVLEDEETDPDLARADRKRRPGLAAASGARFETLIRTHAPVPLVANFVAGADHPTDAATSTTAATGTGDVDEKVGSDGEPCSDNVDGIRIEGESAGASARRGRVGHRGKKLTPEEQLEAIREQAKALFSKKNARKGRQGRVTQEAGSQGQKRSVVQHNKNKFRKGNPAGKKLKDVHQEIRDYQH